MIEVRRYGKLDSTGVVLWGCLATWIVASFFSDAMRIALAVASPLIIIDVYRSSLSIKMNQNGCEMKSLFLKKFLKWSEFKTIRMQNFSRANNARDCILYSDRGIIFSTRRIQKDVSWTRTDPPTYFTYRDPFCRSGFYIQFDPTEKCKWAELIRKRGQLLYHVDYEEFMARAEEWGLKIEGLNAPMPPELTKTRKKQ